MDVQPNKCFYQLVTRWSRKRKLDYIKDSLNTVLVLKYHFQNMSLQVFLDNCRDITVIQPRKTPKKKHKKKLSMSTNTNTNRRGVANSDHIVNKIIVSVRLICKGIISIEDITLLRVRMNVVAAPPTFTLPSNNIDTETLTGNETEVNENSSLVNENNALTHMHAAKAFINRIWMNFDAVKLKSYILYFLLVIM